MTIEPSTEPGARFKRTLFQVLIIQAIALALLWALQSRFAS
ncbi:MAG: hypothetical protein AABY91_09125 [Gemmatimonadota bacterium]